MLAFSLFLICKHYLNTCLKLEITSVLSDESSFSLSDPSGTVRHPCAVMLISRCLGDNGRSHWGGEKMQNIVTTLFFKK
jgi:hypothetical protein